MPAVSEKLKHPPGSSGLRGEGGRGGENGERKDEDAGDGWRPLE